MSQKIKIATVHFNDGTEKYEGEIFIHGYFVDLCDKKEIRTADEIRKIEY